jgi:hypothetical protein
LKKTMLSLWVCCWVFTFIFHLSPAGAQGIPPEADKLVKEFEAFEAEVMKKAGDEVAARLTTLLGELQGLQDNFTKAGNLDTAVALRSKIAALKVAQKIRGVTILPDPGSLGGFSNRKPGDMMIFKVTGKTSGGSVWGSDLYTMDSNLAMAAVHAGVLKAGQEGLVKVVIAPGQSGYAGSARNGVTSSSWGSYNTSYKVEAVTP